MTEQQDRWDAIRAAVAKRMRRMRIPDQATLKRLSGLSQPTVQLYTSSRGTGGVPRPRQAQMLADALQWPADWWDRIEAGEDLANWPIAEQASKPQGDEALRIQFDVGLAALGGEFAKLRDRADQTDARLDDVAAQVAELVAQLSEIAARIDDLDPPPSQRGTKRGR